MASQYFCSTFGGLKQYNFYGTCTSYKSINDLLRRTIWEMSKRFVRLLHLVIAVLRCETPQFGWLAVMVGGELDVVWYPFHHQVQQPPDQPLLLTLSSKIAGLALS
jgi:hypothetical protein